MRKTAFILISALLLAACGGPEKPEKLLSQQEMENVLYDITMLQTIKSFAPQKLTENKVDAREYIFKKYKIDSLTLAQNQLYYAYDLEVYKKMQKNITERIKAEKEKITGKKPKGKTAQPANTTTALPPQAGQNNTDAQPVDDAKKAALQHRRDSLRNVAQQKLKKAPLRTLKRD
jgi:hypothetical protein